LAQAARSRAPLARRGGGGSPRQLEAMPGAPPELLRLPENRRCADCNSSEPKWASVNIGIFICDACAGIHRGLGTHITVVKSVTLDEWQPEWINACATVGNVVANSYYECNVPAEARYDREVLSAGGDKIDPIEAKKLKAWIIAKYETMQFAPVGVDEPWRRLNKGTAAAAGLDSDGGTQSDRKDKTRKHRSSKSKKQQGGDVAIGEGGGHDWGSSAMPPGGWPQWDAGEPGSYQVQEASADGFGGGALGWPSDDSWSPTAMPGHASPLPHAAAPAAASGPPPPVAPRQLPPTSTAASPASPTDGAAAWAVDDRRKAVYATAFRKADGNGDGFVEGSEAKEVLARACLPDIDLQHIWRLSDVGQDGRLSFGEFVCAMHIATRRSKERVALPSVLPQELKSLLPMSLADVPPASPAANGTGGDRAAGPISSPVHGAHGGPSAPFEPPVRGSPAGGQQAATAELNSPWRLDAREREQYRVTFSSLDQMGVGMVSPEVGKLLFEKSQLPIQDLSHIWRISDLDRDGNLKLEEFICAMALVARCRQGVPLPQTLPIELLKSVASPVEVPLAAVAQAPPASPTGENAPPHTSQPTPPPWGLDYKELERYRATFASLDHKGIGMVSPEDGRALFEKSGLPVQELSHIWRLSDLDRDGNLRLEEFICAMALVARRLQGGPLPPTLPSAMLDSVTAKDRPQVGTPYADERSPATAPAPSAQPAQDWAIGEEELAKYRAIFDNRVVHDGSRFADPVAAKEVLEKSGLPSKELSRIWQMSDLDGDGRLSAPEFVCAMAIVGRRMRGIDLPQAPPPELLASVGVAASGDDNRVDCVESPVSRASGLSNASSPSNTVQKDSLPVQPRPPADTPATAVASSQWSVDSSELEQYTQIFNSIDQKGSGMVSPDEGKALFEQSQLPVQELSQIWRMSDLDRDGHLTLEEFICAMALVRRRRQGAPLPQTLPVEMLASARRPAPAENEVSSSSDPPAAALASLATPSAEQWTVGEEELSQYRAIFVKVDPDGSGFADNGEAKVIFEKSQLPMDVLSRIWQMSDFDGDGRLALSEFLCAMALVKRCTEGAELPPRPPEELLASLGGASGAPGSGVGGGVAAGALAPMPTPAPQGTGSGGAGAGAGAALPWAPDAQELESHRTFFGRFAAGSPPSVGHGEVKGFFESSELPTAQLALVWQFSDVDADGRLSMGEFACAMTLISRLRQGAAMPAALPEELVQLASGDGTSLDPCDNQLTC